jgi:hypothetical protein
MTDTDRERPTRRARIRTDHGDGDRASAVAAALAPDNTAEMATRVDGATVETTIERPTTGGLSATIDDYVVNLRVAARVIEGSEVTETGTQQRTDAKTNTDADTDTDTETTNT